jgi:hypothetical protein
LKIIRPKRDELSRERKNLHNNEPNNLYSIPCTVKIVKVVMRAGNVTRLGDIRNIYRIFRGKLLGK